MSKSSSFELLDIKVQNWVYKQDWISLRDIQEKSIPVILGHDGDVIISANTASGKTEAAFLPILTYLLKHQNETGYQVLYVSPLKALINNQYGRLSEMAANTGIDVVPWHGDITQSVKQMSLKSPNGIILITPESLESFFVNRNRLLNKVFSNLQYIVIDELHSFIGSERGKQLQSLLSRIEYVTSRIIPRIVMSATFSDFDAVKEFLRTESSFPCYEPIIGEAAHMTNLIIKEYVISTNCKSEEVDYMICEDIYNKLRGSNNLVFANSRKNVETYTVILKDMCNSHNVPDEFRPHHGNLSKNIRSMVEQELQKEEHPVTAICSSTLELGIDIGKVKSVAQLGYSSSISALRQRLGRSGRRGEPSVLRVYSIDDSSRDSLLGNLYSMLFQNISIIELLIEKQYEKPNIEKYHFSTLIQQILSTIAQYGSFYPKDGWLFLCKKGAFQNINSELFLDLLRDLGSNKVISQTNTGQIIIGVEGEKILRHHDFYTAFTTTVDIDLVDISSNKLLGTIQEVPGIGKKLIFAGRKWEVVSMDGQSKRVYAKRINDNSTIYFNGSSPNIDAMISKKMYDVYNSDIIYSYLDIKAKNALALGRAFYNAEIKGKEPFINYKGCPILITWKGSIINETISLIVANATGTKPISDGIFVSNISKDCIAIALSKGKPDPSDLASSIRRSLKVTEKYDYLLSDDILNLEYAKSKLDVDKAWKFLELLDKNYQE